MIFMMYLNKSLPLKEKRYRSVAVNKKVVKR